MNLFILHTEPRLAAQAHHDVHVRKQIVETAQMLSTAHYELGSWFAPMYKPTHINHKCNKWVRARAANYRWAYVLFVALCDEYEYRTGKKHKTDAKLRGILWRLPRPLLNDAHEMARDVKGFVLAMPDEYKNYESAIGSYRAYYNGEKHLDKNGQWMGTYTRREPPKWWQHADYCNDRSHNPEVRVQ